MQMAAAIPIVIQNSAEMNDRRLSYVSNSSVVKAGQNSLLWRLRERQLQTGNNNKRLTKRH
jgi:hypothetical protein